jgi:hypothetical protein
VLAVGQRGGEGPAALDQEERRVLVLPPVQIILKKAKIVVALDGIGELTRSRLSRKGTHSKG